MIGELCDQRSEEVLTLLFLSILEIEVEIGDCGSRIVTAEPQDILDDGRTEDRNLARTQDRQPLSACLRIVLPHPAEKDTQVMHDHDGGSLGHTVAM